MTGEGAGSPTLRLARWTVASGSNARSRGAVVIASGDHQWEASAEGNGAIDALFRTDLELKNSGDARVLLERLVVELCGPKPAKPGVRRF